jgi:hypothetical protein
MLFMRHSTAPRAMRRKLSVNQFQGRPLPLGHLLHTCFYFYGPARRLRLEKNIMPRAF